MEKEKDSDLETPLMFSNSRRDRSEKIKRERGEKVEKRGREAFGDFDERLGLIRSPEG